MPKGGGSKTPQLDHFPLNTDMVEKQGGKKVRLNNLQTHTVPNYQMFVYSISSQFQLLFVLETWH